MVIVFAFTGPKAIYLSQGTPISLHMHTEDVQIFEVKSSIHFPPSWKSCFLDILEKNVNQSVKNEINVLLERSF